MIDDIFLTQVWSGNAALRAKLRQDTSALGKARLHYFDLNKGPWSDLDEQAAFLPGVPPKKLPGANFYPEDMTKEEFETWAQMPSSAGAARDSSRSSGAARTRSFTAVPYSVAYKSGSGRGRRSCSRKPRR